jgi:hypothetical protein
MHTALLVNCALNIKNNNMNNPKGENLCNCGPETFLHGKTGTVECGPGNNKIKTLMAVVAVQDEDGDWFVIPTDQHEDFRRLAGRINASFGPEDDARFEEEFETKFRRYATGGDLNNVQLYAEI